MRWRWREWCDRANLVRADGRTVRAAEMAVAAAAGRRVLFPSSGFFRLCFPSPPERFRLSSPEWPAPAPAACSYVWEAIFAT
jgi:hypothetical protein